MHRLLKYEKQLEDFPFVKHGLVKVSTGVLQVEKLSGAVRHRAKLKINANNRVALAA